MRFHSVRLLVWIGLLGMCANVTSARAQDLCHGYTSVLECPQNPSAHCKAFIKLESDQKIHIRVGASEGSAGGSCIKVSYGQELKWQGEKTTAHPKPHFVVKFSDDNPFDSSSGATYQGDENNDSGDTVKTCAKCNDNDFYYDITVTEGGTTVVADPKVVVRGG